MRDDSLLWKSLDQLFDTGQSPGANVMLDSRRGRCIFIAKIISHSKLFCITNRGPSERLEKRNLLSATVFLPRADDVTGCWLCSRAGGMPT